METFPAKDALISPNLIFYKKYMNKISTAIALSAAITGLGCIEDQERPTQQQLHRKITLRVAGIQKVCKTAAGIAVEIEARGWRSFNELNRVKAVTYSSCIQAARENLPTVEDSEQQPPFESPALWKDF